MTSMGKRVARLREQFGLKPIELAERIGIKQPSLHAIEHGRTKTLRGNTLARLCEELHTTADFLLHGTIEGQGLELASMEAELIYTIRTLAPERRVALMEYARYLMAQEPGRAQTGTRQAAASNIQPIKRKRPRAQ